MCIFCTAIGLQGALTGFLHYGILWVGGTLIYGNKEHIKTLYFDVKDKVSNKYINPVAELTNTINSSKYPQVLFN